MTPKEKVNFNRMREALIRITKYQTPDRLKKDSKKDWGLDYSESLEMAYENMQDEARFAVKGIKSIK